MSAPRLDELPRPPAGRTGWPWTEASAPLPDVLDGIPWPRITVVVPSYQQAAFLEETLRSVLLQGYPNLELLVMDGGSTDGTVDILRRYDKWIDGWVSEKDGGQTEAINKGWRRAKGELLTWLNSDDVLAPNWAAETARVFAAEPDVDLVYCDVQVMDAQSRPLWVYAGQTPTVEQVVIYWRTTFAQQGFLMRRRVLEICGPLDERRHFAMDAEYWLRLLVAGRRFRPIPQVLGRVRMHEETKTSKMHAVHVSDLVAVTTQFCRTAPPELSGLAEQARRRLYWNVAHAKYDGHVHVEARRAALRYVRDAGWRVLPRAGAMVVLSCLGEPGHKALALFRRLRSSYLTTSSST